MSLSGSPDPLQSPLPCDSGTSVVAPVCIRACSPGRWSILSLLWTSKCSWTTPSKWKQDLFLIYFLSLTFFEDSWWTEFFFLTSAGLFLSLRRHRGLLLSGPCPLSNWVNSALCRYADSSNHLFVFPLTAVIHDDVGRIFHFSVSHFSKARDPQTMVLGPNLACLLLYIKFYGTADTVTCLHTVHCCFGTTMAGLTGSSRDSTVQKDENIHYLALDRKSWLLFLKPNSPLWFLTKGFYLSLLFKKIP